MHSFYLHHNSFSGIMSKNQLENLDLTGIIILVTLINWQNSNTNLTYNPNNKALKLWEKKFEPKPSFFKFSHSCKASAAFPA